jgi:VCBS repeat-containing protein
MFNRYCNTLKGVVKVARKNLVKEIITAIIVVALASFLLPSATFAATNGTTTGSLSLDATCAGISVISNFSGDDDADNQATLYYKQSSSSAWTPCISMTADRRATLTPYGSGAITNTYKNQWRAVVYGIVANTSYDIRVDYTDADGGSGSVQGTIATKNDNPLSSGNTYYVATTGSDTGTGTSASPWKTIQKAANTVQAGDTVRIKAGTYSEQVTVKTSGTSTNYITFTSDDAANKAIVTSSGSGGTIYIADKNYNRIQNLQIRNTGASAAVYLQGNAIGNIVENDILSCTSDDWWAGGVYVVGEGLATGPSYTIISGNTITTTANGNNGPNAIMLDESGGSTVIRNNTISGGFFDGISGCPNFGVKGGPRFNTYIYGNNISNVNDDGIEVEGGGLNCAVWGNTLKNTAIGIGSAPCIIGPLYIFRNTVNGTSASGIKLGSSSNGFVYYFHNVIYNIGDANVATSGSDYVVSNIIFRNNIFQYSQGNGYVIEDSSSTGLLNFDYDSLYTERSDVQIKWKGSQRTFAYFVSTIQQETHGRFGEVTFTNAASNNFALPSGSPCIDKGVVLAGFNDANSPWPYSGSAPDMGAVESGSGGSTNRAPAAANDAYSTNTNTALTMAAPGVLSNDTDADGNSLTASKVSNPAHGTLTLNSNGSFTFTPTTGYTGTDTFTYYANDGQVNSNTATVTITINAAAVNNAPVAVNDTYTTNEDTALNVAAAGVLSNDTDADGNTLTAAKVTDPSHGTLTLNSNGSFTYTPTANYNGTDTFTYRANDGQANSNTATVTITITAANDVPVAANDAYTTNEDTTLTIAAAGVLSNDTDADGNTLTAVKVANPSHGTVTLNSNGSFTYTPTTDYNGTDTFTYRANDGQANSNTTTVTITVNAIDETPVNNAPVLNPIGGKAVTAGQLLTFTVLATDPDGNTLTYAASNLPSGAVFTPVTGVFSWTPASSQTGTFANVRFQVSDGTLTDYENITITVNTAPADTTPPQVSGISFVVVSSTSVNINWSTNELSDGQVEYSASPSQLSDKNPNLVTNHQVPLTGLLTGTTYTYKVMSADAAGNLTVVSGGTFTTPTTGAVYSVSSLSIKPSVVYPWQRVNVSVIATNKGTVKGTYTIQFKVNGVVESTRIVTLAAGAKQYITFYTSKTTAGTYTVDVNGLAGSFLVKSYWR